MAAEDVAKVGPTPPYSAHEGGDATGTSVPSTTSPPAPAPLRCTAHGQDGLGAQKSHPPKIGKWLFLLVRLGGATRT